MRRLNGPKVREIRYRSVRRHKRAESALPEGAEGVGVECALERRWVHDGNLLLMKDSAEHSG